MPRQSPDTAICAFVRYPIEFAATTAFEGGRPRRKCCFTEDHRRGAGLSGSNRVRVAHALAHAARVDPARARPIAALRERSTSWVVLVVVAIAVLSFLPAITKIVSSFGCCAAALSFCRDTVDRRRLEEFSFMGSKGRG